MTTRRILAIETSCDETSAAVIEDGQRILANVVASQIRSHMRFGGVVPEVASRHHTEQITQVIQLALEQAELELSDLDAVAVTQGPGLVGALLVGVTAAKSLREAIDCCKSFGGPYLCSSVDATARISSAGVNC